jgi:hypothetical protein
MNVAELIDSVLYGSDGRGEEAGVSRQGQPSPLETYLKKVSVGAYQVTDDDLAALREAGYSEDEIYQATVDAAFGAGVYRLGRVGSLARRR